MKKVEPSTAELLLAEKVKKLTRENRVAEGELMRTGDAIKRLRKMERALIRELQYLGIDGAETSVQKHIGAVIADLTPRD